jgi:hypothetical protein
MSETPATISPADASKDAIHYALNRIRESQQAAYQFGFGTETFARLTKAYAMLTDQAEWRVAAWAQNIEVPESTAEIMAIDLQKFCEPFRREEIATPWSSGVYTYATNGYVLVRVPRRDDIEQRIGGCSTAWVAKKLYSGDQWRPLPPIPEGPHIIVQHRVYDADWIRVIASLPGVEIGPDPKYLESTSGELRDPQAYAEPPLSFRFCGGIGVGLLMPMYDRSNIAATCPRLFTGDPE